MSENAQAITDPVDVIAGILDAENNPPPEEELEGAPEEDNAEELAAESQDNAEEDDDGMEEVEYEGDQYRLPKKLKEALLRQSDYTRKTQEVAEQRRAIEARNEHVQRMEQQFQAQTEFHQAIMQDVTGLQQAESTLRQYESIDWNALSDSDPVQAQKLWFSYQKARGEADQMRQQISVKQQQFVQWKESQKQQALKAGMEILKKDMPDFGPELQAKIRKSAKEVYGFSDAELGNLYDARLVKVMADAARYREILASKPETQKRVANVPKTIQPGAKQSNSVRVTQQKQEAFQRLRKSGRVEDAAAAIAKLI